MRLAASSVVLAVALSVLAPTAFLADSPEALADGGHWKRLRALVEPRVKASPNDAEALWLLGRVKMAFGDREAALPLLEKAVALNGRNADYHVTLADVCGGLAQSAGLFRQMSLGRRAKSELDAALAVDPRNLDALWGTMQFLWQAPGLFGGDKDKARKTAGRIGEIDPARGYLAQAQIAVFDKQPAKLEDLYRKAAEADPRSYPAQMTLANFYASQSPPRFDVAEKYAQAASALAPDRAGAYATLARIYARQQRVPDLDRVLADAERNVPDNPAPFLNAANALLGDGKDLPRAEAYIRKYLAQEREGNTTTHGVARWRLALVLEKEGRRQEAVAEAENAARLEPKREDIAKDLARMKAAKK